MTDSIIGLLGIMRKASAVTLGEDRTADAVSNGKARLLILSSDTGEKQEARLERLLEGHSTQIIKLALSSEELGRAVGIGRCSVLGVTDLGFARTLLKKLRENDPGMYEEAAEKLERRFQKIERRKIEKPRGGFKKG